MALLLERMGSREFNRGSGQILFYVLEVDSEDAAVAAALASPLAAEDINGYLRDDYAVRDAGNFYEVDLLYKRNVPNPAAETIGTTPASSRPAPAGTDPNEQLSRDVSVTMGGGTTPIYQSRQTKYRVGKGDTEPPDFFGMIGFNRKTKEFMGTEIHSNTSSYQITRRVKSVTLGYFRHVMDLACTLNSSPYLGTDSEETLFLSMDLNYRQEDSSDFPWTLTGHFEYGRKRANVPIDNINVELAELIIPEVAPFDYVWVMTETVKEIYRIEGVDMPVLVERPQFAYCERVYQLDSEVNPDGGSSLDDLGLN